MSCIGLFEPNKDSALPGQLLSTGYIVAGESDTRYALVYLIAD